MSVIVPIISRPLPMAILVAAWNAGIPLTCRLFKNNYTPADATLVSDFDEADYAGYAAQVLTGWSDIGYDVDNRSILEADALTWTITASNQTIYGMYVTSAGGTVLWWGERRAAGPIALDAATNPSFVLIPRFSGTSEF